MAAATMMTKTSLFDQSNFGSVQALVNDAQSAYESHSSVASSRSHLIIGVLSWAGYVVFLTASTVEIELFGEIFDDGSLSIDGVIIWSYIIHLIICCAPVNLALFISKSRDEGYASGWNFEDCWKHLFGAFLTSFDVTACLMAVAYGGALLITIVRLVGCMCLTVVLLKIVAGREIGHLQKALVIPMLASTVAASIMDGEQAEDSGEQKNVGFALFLVSVSVVCNSLMATFLEVAFVDGPMCFQLRQTLDSVGTMVPIIAFRLVRAAAGQASYNFLAFPGLRGMIMAVTIALWQCCILATIKLLGADMYALGKVVAVVLTYFADIAVIGKHFNIAHFLVIVNVAVLCGMYILAPLQIAKAKIDGARHITDQIIHALDLQIDSKDAPEEADSGTLQTMTDIVYGGDFVTSM